MPTKNSLSLWTGLKAFRDVVLCWWVMSARCLKTMLGTSCPLTRHYFSEEWQCQLHCYKSLTSSRCQVFQQRKLGIKWQDNNTKILTLGIFFLSLTYNTLHTNKWILLLFQHPASPHCQGRRMVVGIMLSIVLVRQNQDKLTLFTEKEFWNWAWTVPMRQPSWMSRGLLRFPQDTCVPLIRLVCWMYCFSTNASILIFIWKNFNRAQN